MHELELDGRPLLLPSECYWVVNASPLKSELWPVGGSELRSYF